MAYTSCPAHVARHSKPCCAMECRTSHFVLRYSAPWRAVQCHGVLWCARGARPVVGRGRPRAPAAPRWTRGTCCPCRPAPSRGLRAGAPQRVFVPGFTVGTLSGESAVSYQVLQLKTVSTHPELSGRGCTALSKRPAKQRPWRGWCVLVCAVFAQL